MSLWVNRPLRGGLWAVLLALGLALLGACGPLPFWNDVQHKPDVSDNIRNQDLLPRFPQGAARTVKTAPQLPNHKFITGEEVSPVEAPPAATAADDERAGLRTQF